MTNVDPQDRLRARLLTSAGYNPDSASQNATISKSASSPGLDDEESRNPIGVPPDYNPPVRIDRGNIFSPSSDYITNPLLGQPPQYFYGDEKIPAGYPIETRIRMQQDLIDAGVLDLKSGYRVGEWDVETQKAYATVLARANMTGQSYQQSLSELKLNVQQYGKPRDTRTIQPGIIELTNPRQISNLADEVSVRVLGRRLDPSEAQRFAETYNQMEREYQQRAYQLRLEGQDNSIAGEVTQPASLQSFAESDIAPSLKASDPQASSTQTTLNAADIFFDMLRSNRTG